MTGSALAPIQGEPNKRVDCSDGERRAREIEKKAEGKGDLDGAGAVADEVTVDELHRLGNRNEV